MRYGIPCIEEAQELLIKAGVKQAIIPAEIYVYDEKKRTRTNDLLKVLARESKIGTLRLAAFEFLELDGKSTGTATLPKHGKN